jgi:hypothetical protein
MYSFSFWFSSISYGLWNFISFDNVDIYDIKGKYSSMWILWGVEKCVVVEIVTKYHTSM